MKNGTRVGLAFQGGSFLAGAIATGVVHALVDRKVFDTYHINAFSGTSAGALVAAMCWGHKLRDSVAELPEDLRRQWLHNALGIIPTEEAGSFWKLFDRWASMIPLYFKMKETISIPMLHKMFQDWVVEYVKPEECMQVLYDKYVAPRSKSTIEGWLEAAGQAYLGNDARPRLVVGVTEIHQGQVVTIDDEDMFDALLDAFATAVRKGKVDLKNPKAVEDARARAIKVGAEYMTQALMASGSLDTINGMTEIDDIEGITDESLLHKGHYLDGAWATNPPISELTNCQVSQIWTVEIFPKICVTELDTNEKREDRREELWQNALVEHEVYLINRVNLWLESGRLLNDPAKLKKEVIDRLSDPSRRESLIKAFKAGVLHPERYTTDEAIADKLSGAFTHVIPLKITLPAQLQPLTDGARIVNSPAFLIDKMNIGYQNTVQFLDQVAVAA